MTIKSDIRCKHCASLIEKDGETYHRVYPLTSFGIKEAPDYMPNAIARCEQCGGFTDGENWAYHCVTCKKDVKPGELTGLFVPHNCHDCQQAVLEKQRKSGQVCGRCRQPFANCCC